MQSDTNAFLAAKLVGRFFSLAETITYPNYNDFRVKEHVTARWLVENFALRGELDTCMCPCSRTEA